MQSDGVSHFGSVRFTSDRLDSLAKEGSTQLKFLDFVAYLPLFVNIHDDIRRNTLTKVRDFLAILKKIHLGLF